MTRPQDDPPTEAIPRLAIGPVAVARLSRDAAIARLLGHVERRDKCRVAFANAHGLLLAMDDPGYADTLARFLVLNDGIGAEIGARLLCGRGFADNLNGTDFTPALLAAAPPGTRVYLLGARPEIVAKAAAAFARTHPHLDLCGFRDGYFGAEAHAGIVQAINAARTDILLVAMGNPKQEVLIDALSAEIEAPLALGVGALFDFTAGTVARAPRAMRALGLEWLFRFAQEPRRLARRYTTGVLRYFWKIGALWLRARVSRA